MPYQTNGKRDYKKQYEKYDGKEDVKKDRAKRNTARRRAEREGKVSKGDGKHIDHKMPLSSGGSNSKSNTRVVSAKTNLDKEAKRKKRNG